MKQSLRLYAKAKQHEQETGFPVNPSLYVCQHCIHGKNGFIKSTCPKGEPTCGLESRFSHFVRKK